MKKKSALVFTGISKTWFQNCKNILLSESCIVKNFDDKKYKSYDIKISKKRFNRKMNISVSKQFVFEIRKKTFLN